LDGTPVDAEKLIDAALTLTAERGWRALSLPQIAAAAGVSLADAYSAFQTKTALLNGIMARTDRLMLAGEAPDMGENVRDRLFDVVMRRLDALEPHKEAVAAIVDELPADPLTVLAVLPQFATSMAWTLEAAGVSASGMSGALRVKGLAVIYLTTLRTWLQDDSADAARTMAALDRALRRTEMLVHACPGLPWRRSRQSDADWAPDDVPSGGVPSGGVPPGEVPPGEVPSGEVPSGDAPGAGSRG
jgi:AcrR family transcriptional regulator